MVHVIAGIDPGKASALAVLDLNSNILLLATKRFAGLRWFVDSIKSAGTPVIVAGDKKNTDAMTNKIAATFGAVCFAPRYDIGTDRKKEMTSSDKIGNAHERDALAAAKTAFNAYANKFKQAEKTADRASYADIDKLKAMVVMRYSMHEAITGKEANRR